MKTHFFFTDWIYNQDYLVVLASSNSAFRKIVKKEVNLELPEANEASGQFHGYESNDNRLGIIWSKDMGETLIHECLHATSWTLNSRGICCDSQSGEEAWAYYITFLVKYIKANVKSNKKERKQKKEVKDV